MSVDWGTLTLNTDLLLCEDDALIQKVLNGEIRCDKLVILGTARTFDGSFLGSDSYETFWMKLGETVTSLEIHERTTLDLGLYLSNIRSLSIVKPGIYQDILLNLSKNHVALEELTINENLIDFGVTGPKEVDSNVGFFSMLQVFRPALKCVTFVCSMLLQKDVVTILCSELKQIFENLEVMFDCEPLPQFSKWLIEKIKIELVKDRNATKLVVKPLFLRQLTQRVRGVAVEKYFANEGIFRSGSVEKLCFSYDRLPEDFYRNCFVSFPSVREVTNLNKTGNFIFGQLDLISEHWKHLKDLSIDYDTWGYQNKRPHKRTTVENVTISFNNEYPITWKGFIESFPSLRKLSLVSVSSGGRDMKIGMNPYQIIINANNLEYLSIKNDDRGDELTSRDLDLIRRHLKNLKELHVECIASYANIENLFEELPTLEVFSYGHSTLYRRFLNRKPLPNEKGINDLPFELIERIFLYLTAKEQRTCRQVCKYWFDILSSSPRTDRTLNLSYSKHFSYETKPVNIFINTNFKYNKIIFDDTIFWNMYEDLTEFWKKIGAEVKEIALYKNKGRNLADKKVGLKAEHFPKLKKLKVYSLSLLYQLLEQDIPKWKALLDQVETSSIKTDFEDTCGFEVSMSNVTQLKTYISENSGAAFQQISFPKLQTLNILHGSWQCFEFKNINYAQIKTFQFQCYYDENYFDLIVENCPNVECLTLSDTDKTPDLPKEWFDKLMYLEHLNFVNYYWISSFHRTGSGIERTHKYCLELRDYIKTKNNKAYNRF